MSTDLTLNAEIREDLGKGASRRLRRLNNIMPAVIYGAGKESRAISIAHNEMLKAVEKEAFFANIIDINIAGASEKVLLKDLQRHPSRPIIMHADFLRVDMDKKVTVNAALHFINEDTSVGVKTQGGIISHSMTELEISCLPSNIPEYLELDLANVEVGQVLHISDIPLPEGVESVALSHGDDHDLPVVAINLPKGGDSDEDAEDAPAAGEEAAEGDSNSEDDAAE